jgi:hypothetical protein
MQREMEVLVADHRAEVTTLKDKIAALGAPQGEYGSGWTAHNCKKPPCC